MLRILEPYLPTPDEGRKVAQALKSIEFPPWVVNWDYELGSDEEGGAAAWINLFADRKHRDPATWTYAPLLLALAKELVDRNPGAPITADLRRGVSSAYYAVFPQRAV